MYIPNEKEKACLVTIAIRVRIDYLRKKKYTYYEDDIDMINEDIFVSNENIENDYERKYDMEIKSNEIEKIFENSFISKSVELLSNKEKFALFSYYVEQKRDKAIGQEMNCNGKTVQKIRERAINKTRKKYFKFKGEN